MNSKKLVEYLQDMFVEYEKIKEELITSTDTSYDVLSEIASDYSFLTTYIHDDDELEKSDYYVVRKTRDALQDALDYLACTIANENR